MTKKPQREGLFGILPRGPIREALFENREFKDRKFLDIIIKDTDEARSFRQSILSGIAASIVLGAYLESIIGRLPSPRDKT